MKREILQKLSLPFMPLYAKAVPSYKRGKKLYFYREELIQWIESGRKAVSQPISSEEMLAMMRANVRNKPKSIK